MTHDTSSTHEQASPRTEFLAQNPDVNENLPDWVFANRKRLAEALRSHKYQQARRRLRVGSRYCCLGVACDLLWPNNWEKSLDAFRFDDPANDPDATEPFESLFYASSQTILTDSVCIAYGMNPTGMFYPESLDEDIKKRLPQVQFGPTIDLSAINDAGANFLLIADVVEHAVFALNETLIQRILAHSPIAPAS